MNNIHYISDVTFYSNNMKEAITKYKTLPLWTPYYYSGRPLFAQPEYYFIDFNLLLILLTGNIILAMNSSVIIHLFLAGLGMYFLVLFLNENKKSAFISALVYMFNGFVHTFVLPGNIMIVEGYSLVPFIFLFTIKALKNKDFVFNSIIAGIFAAFQIFVGGVIFLPYIFLLIAVYSIFYLTDKNFLNRILKLAIVGSLIFAIGFGFSAIKLLPGIEFMKLSNRGIGLPYQEFLGEPIKVKNFDFAFISNVFFEREHISSAIGIAAFLLIISSLGKIKNKNVLFGVIIIMLSLLISSETFLTKTLYNLPMFNQTRHIERSIFMYVFASSILASFGFMNLESFIDRYKKIAKNAIFSIIILLIFFELFLLQSFPQSTNVLNPNDIPILDHISKDESLFRVINLFPSDLIAASGYNYYSQLGISDIKGGSGIWFNDYINYLFVAQYAPAKFWGVLNAKYVLNNQNISTDGLSYIAKFKECAENCQVGNAFGPYLFKNEESLPRYYIVPNGILVVGESASVKQLIYTLMLQNWQPESTVLVEGTKINDYDIDFLAKFDYIFLVKDSVDQNSIAKLREYKAKGGIIVPDILNGKNTISNEEIVGIFNKTKGTYKEISVDEYSNNKVVLNLNGENGWLVASERFAYFPGWMAKINGDYIKISPSNNAVSAIYLNGEKGKLTFEYNPEPYKKGKLISITAFILIILYFSFLIYKKKTKAGGKNQA